MVTLTNSSGDEIVVPDERAEELKAHGWTIKEPAEQGQEKVNGDDAR